MAESQSVASKRTTSSTVYCQGWTYIFLNRPDTDYIDCFKFKQANDASNSRSIIGTSAGKIKALAGPLSALVLLPGSGKTGYEIRLYYTAAGNKGQPTLQEAKLENAESQNSNPSKNFVEGVSDKGVQNGMTFESKITANTRLMDETSFVSASAKEMEDGSKVSSVCFKPSGDDDYFQYTFQHPTQGWTSQSLELTSK